MMLVIDIGKTRSKLLVLGIDNKVEFAAEQSSLSRDTGPYLHLDTDATWQWILQSLTDSALAAQIVKCVVVAHGAAFALLAGTELAIPIMDYEFDAFDVTDGTYDGLRDPFDKSYSPRLSAGLNAGRQIYYVQENFPDIFKSITAIVPLPQYWAARLCGVLATEVTSLGCHTDLWLPELHEYSQLAVNNGWHNLMPPLRSAWQALGQVLPELASTTGLNPGCQIYCGIHDSNASYLGYLPGEESQVCVVSTGTWVVCMAGGESLLRLDAIRDMLANVDVFGRPVPCARFFGGREFAELTVDTHNNKRVTNIEARRAMAAECFALPSFHNAQGPFPNTRGKVINPPENDPEKRALASLYCALVTDICLDNLGVSGDLVVEGRYVNDEVFVEALAHFRPQQTLSVSNDLTGTLRGAVRLLNWPDSPPAALTPFQKDRTGDAARVYRNYRDQWRKLVL